MREGKANPTEKGKLWRGIESLKRKDGLRHRQRRKQKTCSPVTPLMGILRCQYKGEKLVSRQKLGKGKISRSTETVFQPTNAQR